MMIIIRSWLFKQNEMIDENHLTSLRQSQSHLLSLFSISDPNSDRKKDKNWNPWQQVNGFKFTQTLRLNECEECEWFSNEHKAKRNDTLHALQYEFRLPKDIHFFSSVSCSFLSAMVCRLLAVKSNDRRHGTEIKKNLWILHQVVFCDSFVRTW